MATEKKKSFIQRLKDAVSSKGRLEKERAQSVEFLRAKLDNFAVYSRKVEQEKIMKKFTATKQPLTGQMIMYIYRAEHDLVLPFWDAAPLVIFMGLVPGKSTHFYGLSLHYLPPVIRASFFDALLDVRTTKNISDNTKLAITYKILKGSQKMKAFRPAWKMYISKNVQSNIVFVPPTEWVSTIFLESAQWKKAGKSTVYQWSRSQLR